MKGPMKKGYLLLLLHAHLPFVRHPEYQNFMEEDWLFEAITETYIPLIRMMERFEHDRLNYSLTMTISPPLAAMLVDPLLQERYIKRLNGLIELSGKEVVRTKGQPDFRALAEMYHESYKQSLNLYKNQYRCNLIQAFRKCQDQGRLDIITCGATHGFLPNMETVPASARAQIAIACDQYERLFGRPPSGIWLPECGFQPGIDRLLNENGIKYFFLDAHGILHGTPRPKYGVYAPVYCPSGVAAFGRDLDSSKQVWSAEEGYPGDYDYREFYRDVGFDLPLDIVKPYLHGEGIRANLGIKYYRITGKGDHKEIYAPKQAMTKAKNHAHHFVKYRERHAERLYDCLGGRVPVIVSPYDAELFGHWWYEGPKFLEYVIRTVAEESDVLQLTTAKEYLKAHRTNQLVTPSFSSWGYMGYSEVWLDGSNDWVYRHVHQASARMTELAERFSHASGMIDRILRQAARELLLAESSDWAFIMKMGTTVDYAKKRVIEHIQNFTRIYEGIQNNSLDLEWLLKIENKNNLFSDVDWRVYAEK